MFWSCVNNFIRVILSHIKYILRENILIYHTWYNSQGEKEKKLAVHNEDII